MGGERSAASDGSAFPRRASPPTVPAWRPLTIRGVDDSVRDALVERARTRGQSLQEFLLALVENEARSSTNLTLLDQFTGRSDGSRMTAAEADAAVEQHRDERDGRTADRLLHPSRHEPLQA